MVNPTKQVLRTGAIAGLAYAGWRARRETRIPGPGDDISWETAPFPFPPVPRPATRAAARFAPFVVPAADGSFPETHPVKAKLASGINHVPGTANYDRTKPDRCYVSAAAAEADGLRAAKTLKPKH